MECAKAIIQSGIKKVVLIGDIFKVIEEHKNIYILVSNMFEESNVKLEIYDIINKKRKE